MDQLDLNVPTGSVYGFLGPNGSGKTTTVRMLLGLIRPTDGELAIFGRTLADERSSILSRVGSMVESPSLYGHLTGRENLEINRRLRSLPTTEIDRVLELVGLSAAADRRAGQYSLGMKQRLGLAHALLGNPDLLILDEPTNGLDPSGIREMRELIRSLPSQAGSTVFLSSHLLNEVEQIATHVGIVHNGSLRFEGSLRELQKAQSPTVEVVASPHDRALTLLNSNGWRAHDGDGRIVVSLASFDDAPRLTRTLVDHDVALYEIRRIEHSLEAVFLGLTDNATEDRV